MDHKMRLILFLLYTFCLLHYPANFSAVGGRLSEVTSKSNNLEGINLSVGRGSPMIRMDRSTANKSYNTFIRNLFLEWSVRRYKRTNDNLNIIFEDKKREDGYKRTAAVLSPHSVLLVILFDYTSFCTGTLLSRTWVLTSAHCVLMDNNTAAKVILYAGGNSYEEMADGRPAQGSQLQESTEFYIHPDYKFMNSFDVAVVRAPRKFNLTKTVNIVRLSDKPWMSKGHKKCTFTGFGSVNRVPGHEDDFTRKTHELKIESPCHCASDLNKVVKAGTYLCSVAREDYGLCGGDSGGGLICDGDVTGVTMFIVEMEDAKTCKINYNLTNDTCGGKNTINVFQDSYLVRDWVKSFLESPKKSKPQMRGHGCNAKLATVLLTLSMIINIV